MPQTLTLTLPGETRPATEVLAGTGALAAAVERLRPWLEGRTVFLLSSRPVLDLHGGALEPLLAPARRRVDLEIPDGEAAKKVEVAAGLWQAMLEAGGKRDSRLVTLGGGSTGDLGGWVAASFLRGIAYAQVPSTLLAQVDASLGGKTGVDLPGGKNTVGAFHHPAFVIAETRFLTSLPREEIRAALAEVVKVALILDPPLLERVEEDLPRLLAGEPEALAPVVVAAAAAKIAVVEEDPKEGDARRLLNLGHTLGHALEAALGYRDLRHGDAVAHGLRFALRLARNRGLDPAVVERVEALLERFELPALPPLEPERLLRLMARDKKARESGLTWVLPAALGRGEMVEGVGEAEVHEELSAFLAESPYRA